MRKLILLSIMILTFYSCSVSSYIVCENNQVVMYYTKVYENYKIKYYPYSPTVSELSENKFLLEDEVSDTIYIIRKKIPGTWTTFSLASPSDIQNINKITNESR